jgi:hypothetical protein
MTGSVGIGLGARRPIGAPLSLEGFERTRSDCGLARIMLRLAILT